MEKIVRDHVETFFKTALAAAAIPFVIFTVKSNDMSKHLLYDIFIGLLAGLAAILLIRTQEKGARAAYDRILERERVLCYIEASVANGRGIMRGRLFVTDKGIRFHELGILGIGRSLCLPYACIEETASAGRKSIDVLMSNGAIYTVTVHRKKDIEKLLEEKIKEAHAGSK